MQINATAMIEYWPQQSPIDLVDAIHAPGLGFTFQNYDQPISGSIVPAAHGHGYEFAIDVDPTTPLHAQVALRIGGQTCPLVKFHFHAHSEHRIAGQCADLEIHLVHDIRCPSGGSSKVVLGVLLNIDRKAKGTAFEFLKQFNEAFGHLKDSGDTTRAASVVKVTFSLADFVKAHAKPQFYRYEGSLTTPPYSEFVSWVILKDIYPVIEKHIGEIVRKVTHTPRPLQPLDRRFLLRNF